MTKEITAYGGREIPSRARSELFCEDRKPLLFGQQGRCGCLTGVPSPAVLLGLARKENGELAWGYPFGDAQRMA